MRNNYDFTKGTQRDIWFIADTHFYHTNILKYENRPFENTHRMNEAMIENWNRVVKPGDIVYHLGDFAMCGKNWEKILLKRLNGGVKILLRGNHDGSATRMKDIGFTEVYDRLELTIAGQRVLLCHYPYLVTENLEHIKNRGEAYVNKFIASRPKNEGLWLLHGHNHSTWKIHEKMINVSVENWDYTPVHISEVERIINGQGN